MKTILVTDVDGTLFATNAAFITAPFYNKQTTKLLKKHAMPFIVATGRKQWTRVDDLQIQLLGMPKPDVVIYGAGTQIFFRDEKGKLTPDTHWLSKTQLVPNISKFISFPYISFAQNNQDLIRIKVNAMKTVDLFFHIASLQKKMGDTYQVLFTEKLLWKNTKDIFSGDIFIMPREAGKDKALKYVLSILNTRYIIHNTIVFGDASIDIPMLSLSLKGTNIYPFLISPTPLAEKEAKKYSKIKIIHGNGPKIILEELNNYCHSERSRNAGESRNLTPIESRESDPPSCRQAGPLVSWIGRDDGGLSPSQNNPTRSFIKAFEPLLDSIFDKKLSANDISFLGLKKVTQGITSLESDSIFKKIKGMYLFAFGNFTDILDGIRARRKPTPGVDYAHTPGVLSTIPGQLVDGFCDRAKEFYQLYIRARKRQNVIARSEATKQSQQNRDRHVPIKSGTHDDGSTTFLSAFSCILPSIARAQAEASEVVVAEKDEKGGSMIDRTKLLFQSLFFHTIGNDNKSFSIDKEIYKRNIATFENRLSFLKRYSRRQGDLGGWIPDPDFAKGFDRARQVGDDERDGMSSFQRAALERFLLYAQLLQETYEIIYKINPKQWNNKAMEQCIPSIKQYLELNLPKLRNEYKFTFYPSLSLKNLVD